MSEEDKRAFGTGDRSFKAAGGEEGLRKLVEAFYKHMAHLEAAKNIYAMHPKPIEASIDKLSRFLCGWLGGPKRYSEKYGPIRIPVAHAHLPIGPAERDAWMACMRMAVAEQDAWSPDFKEYFHLRTQGSK